MHAHIVAAVGVEKQPFVVHLRNPVVMEVDVVATEIEVVRVVELAVMHGRPDVAATWQPQGAHRLLAEDVAYRRGARREPVLLLAVVAEIPARLAAVELAVRESKPGRCRAFGRHSSRPRSARGRTRPGGVGNECGHLAAVPNVESLEPHITRRRNAQGLHGLGRDRDPEPAGIFLAAVVGDAGHLVVRVREPNVDAAGGRRRHVALDQMPGPM